MWNKRHEAEPRQQSGTQPQPQEPVRQQMAPMRVPEPAAGPAVLGRSVIVRGDIHSEQDLTIDGEVQGTVEATGHRLTIGPNGNLQTKGVKAREVIIMGKVKGAV